MKLKHQIINKGLQDFIFISKYARWDSGLKRRETWEEAIDRVCKMHLEKYHFLSNEDKFQIIWAFDLVKQKRILPSMRSIQFGGDAIKAHNTRIFNCCVRHVDSVRAFAEIGYLMLCGCGTGIGLSKKFLSRLPKLVGPEDKTGSVISYAIEDSIEGWSDSLEALLMCYFKNNAYSGRKIIFDYSKIRKKGSLLKTGGGRAPGYKPLKAALSKIKNLFDRIIEEDNEQELRPIHAYDILMHFADAVLSGGIRRTASSVIFQKDDEEMMKAKTYFKVDKYRESIAEDNIAHLRVWIKKRFYDVSFNLNNKFDKYSYQQIKEKNIIGWMYIEPQRARSNNSVILLREEITKNNIYNIIQKTKLFGEPGFVFANSVDTLYNPCFETGFIPVLNNGVCGVQFCNLTSINGNKVETIEDFIECILGQTIIGTCQAGYTDFNYLTKASKQLTEEESLLGNSITGILSSKILQEPENLEKGAKYAIHVNRVWSEKLKINKAARITLVKPEGTGSLVIGVHEPGIHPAHAHKFIRRIQIDNNDIPYKFFKTLNPHMCTKSVWNSNGTDDVIVFPIEIKEGSIIKSDLTAIEHLQLIQKIQHYWVKPGSINSKKPLTHNVSCTVLVKENEWDDVINFLFDNREDFAAVSLLDYNGDKKYEQAPFEKIVTREDEKYFKYLLDNYKEVDYIKLSEKTDETSFSSESSCAGGVCMV